MTVGAPSAPRPARRWSKPAEYWLTRQFVASLNLLGRVLTVRALDRLGCALGHLAYRTMRRYRRVAMSNLRRAYGDQWSDAQIEACARASFRGVGRTLVEFFLRQPRITMEQIAAEVGFEGQEHFEAAFERGKGVVLVTAHYGNWEMMGPRLACAGYQVHAVSRTADDPALDRMIERIRTRTGLRQIPRRRAAREGLLALRQNQVLAILLDQNTLRGGVFVPFFGHPASTATGPAAFALKTGAAVIPTFCRREANGRHTMRAWPPIYPVPTSDRDRDILTLTAAMTAVIEQQIREQPEDWCWIHDRWKTRPESVAVASPAEPG